MRKASHLLYFMIKIPDITIIGGGVIGLLTARELFKAGATVTVIEKNQLGQESSWAGGGILLPLYPWRQADAITRLTLSHFSQPITGRYSKRSWMDTLRLIDH